MLYRSLHIIRHVMPDDRLAEAHMDEDGVVVVNYRYGHIHPALMRDLWSMSTGLGAILEVKPDPDRPPMVQAWLTSGELGMPMRPRLVSSLPLSFEIQVRRDLVDPALLREMNEVAIPFVCGLLVPVLAPPPSLP